MFKDNSFVERDCLEPKEGFLSMNYFKGGGITTCMDDEILNMDYNGLSWRGGHDWHG